MEDAGPPLRRRTQEEDAGEQDPLRSEKDTALANL